MRATIRCFTIALIFLALAQLASAQIVHLVVDDTIQPISAEFIARGIETAQNGDTAVLIDLRTPGGLESSMRDIMEKITTSPVPVIVYVSPTGSRAASAGFLILESADVAAMAPGTNTGAAHPLMTPWGRHPGRSHERKDHQRRGGIHALHRHQARTQRAGRRERCPAIEELHRQGGAPEQLIDIVAPNEQELLKDLNGRTIKRFNGNDAVLNTSGAVHTYDMTVKLGVLNWLMDPNISFIILAIGLLGLYIEFNHPGAIVPGVVGFSSSCWRSSR